MYDVRCKMYVGVVKLEGVVAVDDQRAGRRVRREAEERAELHRLRRDVHIGARGEGRRERRTAGERERGGMRRATAVGRTREAVLRDVRHGAMRVQLGGLGCAAGARACECDV